MKPLVSIVLPIYNGEKFLKPTLDALFLQDYNNFEIIAVDDCSTDSSYNILQSYNDERLKIYKNDVNKGISYTTNKAFSLANGEYIMQQDHDDISLSNRISLSVHFLEENQHISGISGAEKRINKNMMTTNYKDKRKIIIDKDENIVDCEQFWTGAFRNPTCMFRKNILDKLNKWYDENVKVSADMDFFERVNAAGFKWVTIKNVVLFYRKHNNNATKTYKNVAKEEFEKIVINSIRRIMPEITDEQLQLHLKNAFRKGLFTKKEWFQVIEWYKYLILYNKNKEIFIEKAWLKVLAKHYMSAVVHTYIFHPFRGYRALFLMPELAGTYQNRIVMRGYYIYEWQKKFTKYWKYVFTKQNKQ